MRCTACSKCRQRLRGTRLQPSCGRVMRANVRTTMATVGESIARNAAGPDGTPAVNHVASLTVVTPDGELRRVSRQRSKDLFALIVGGYGLFGTVYSITLRIATL